MRHRIIPGALAAVLLTALFAGCGIADLDEQDPAAVFQGSFHPVDPALMIEGDAAAVSQGGVTQVGLGIRGLAPETVHSWTIRRNSCDEEGEQLLEAAVFPSFETDAEGEGDHGQPLHGELSREEVYAVEVYEGEVGLSPLVACATLIAV